MFITIEGSNGVGKTTIVAALVEKLTSLDFDIFLTKEPTKSTLGQFLKTGEEIYRGECLACIAAADRYYHIEKEILPALQSEKLVISDRYVESSLVLQRFDGCTLDFIWQLHSQIIIPDLSIIAMAKPEIIKQRLSGRGGSLSRFERDESREKELLFYKEAAEFLSQHGFNVLVVENEQDSIDGVVDLIINAIQNLSQKDKGD